MTERPIGPKKPGHNWMKGGGIFSFARFRKRFLSGRLPSAAGFFALTALMLAIAGPPRAAQAQVLYGSISGVITDPSGAAVSGAKVLATEQSKGINQQVTTDASGLYRFSEILPGTWKITVTAPGFSPVETDNIVVDANGVARVDEKMAVGQVQQNVTVTAAPPELQTDRADVHTDISTTELQELPTVSSEGKNFQGLLRIIPGSTIPLENNSAAGNPARAMTSNVNGQSTQGNNTRIDGILDAYPWLPNNVAYVPPEDALATVNIVTNSYDAEQGGVNGAAINVQTKTGTNKFHGDAYEFHTDADLKAINYFEPPTFKRPENIFNQFGGRPGRSDYERQALLLRGLSGDPPGAGARRRQPADRALREPAVQQRAKAPGYFDFRPFQTAAYGMVDKAGNPVHIYDPNTGNADGTGRTPDLLQWSRRHAFVFPESTRPLWPWPS